MLSFLLAQVTSLVNFAELLTINSSLQTTVRGRLHELDTHATHFYTTVLVGWVTRPSSWPRWEASWRGSKY